MNDTNQILTDEQIDQIATQLDEEIKGTSLEDLSNLPSNRGKTERSTLEVTESGKYSSVMITVDPNTGENKILGKDNGSDNRESFSEMCEKIKDYEIKDSSCLPITMDEFKNATNNDDSIFNEIIKDNHSISDESISVLLSVLNRKRNKESFNIYKALPEELQNIIDTYLVNNNISDPTKAKNNQFKNLFTESLIDEIISSIELERIQSDFNKELESLFIKGSEEISESIVGYTIERNKLYREAVENIEDEEKKEKLIKILDQIDMGYSLDNLKEFAKNCRVKNFELEKPVKVYNSFHLKYENSPYNIYNLNMCRPILSRNLNMDIKFIDLFLIVFCKYCKNMKPDNTYEHAFMYYTIYNIMLIDMNRSEKTKNVSDIFISNIKDVIENARKRNNL